MNYSISVNVDETEFFRTTIKTDSFKPDDPVEDIMPVFFSCGAEFKGVVSVLDRYGNMMVEAGFGSEKNHE